MDNSRVDVRENAIYHRAPKLLEILLKARSTDNNIIWETDNYSSRGYGYQWGDPITIETITGYNGNVIKPRIEKPKEEQTNRIRNIAEVFTPSWVCNKQNNLIDMAWFDSKVSVFNQESSNGWITTVSPIPFPTLSGKTWKDYVSDIRLEISCGEVPYLTSRYDTVTGKSIAIPDRIGLLDRKLRVVSENVTKEKDWVCWAIKAYKSIYGYDYQGDNVLLARENLLITFTQYFSAKFNKAPELALLYQVAEIISWNIWQMDGLRYIIPGSCEKMIERQISLFDSVQEQPTCQGCAKNDPLAPIGIYCKIKDWESSQVVDFISLLER